VAEHISPEDTGLQDATRRIRPGRLTTATLNVAIRIFTDSAKIN